MVKKDTADYSYVKAGQYTLGTTEESAVVSPATPSRGPEAVASSATPPPMPEVVASPPAPPPVPAAAPKSSPPKVCSRVGAAGGG